MIDRPVTRLAECATLLRIAAGSVAAVSLLLASLPEGGDAQSGRAARSTTSVNAQPVATTAPGRLAEACAVGDPYFAVAIQVASNAPGDEPAVVALRDTAADAFDDVTVLATEAEVGTVHGLAYDATRRTLYAASYFKRGTRFGPAGPGATYRIDLAGGAGGGGSAVVAPFVTLPGHSDPHDFVRNADEPAAPLVGKIGLGDIDIGDTDGDGADDVLFVANVLRGRIERISIPDGTVLTAFDDGARATAWFRDARLFGLMWHDGWLYHGVMNSRERDPGVPTVHVYRSRADGSSLESVLEVGLDYPRPAQWAQWQDPLAPWAVVPSGRAGPAQPMVSDLEFTRDGHMLIGLRDRWTDMMAAFKGTSTAFGAGDVLLAQPSTDGWTTLLSPERYSDSTLVDEATWGGLARHPGLDVFVASALRTAGLDVGLAWFDVERGDMLRREPGAPLALDAADRRASGAGDTEVLCPALDEAPPGAIATATAIVAATMTAAPGATAAAATATAAAVPQATPVPGVAIPQACTTDNPFIATACYPGWTFFPTTFRWPAVVAFRDSPADSPSPITLAWDTEIGSVWGLAFDARRDRVLAAAFLKRLAPFGPGGPGAIYGIDVASSDVEMVARVDSAVTDPHEPLSRIGPFTDAGARDWAGKSGLGDLEFDLGADTIFVVGLEDRRIHRYTGSGAPIGSFAHGAASEMWAVDARPFGLAVHAGRLYHGVVRSAESSQKRSELHAFVFESRFDGSEMRQVIDLPLDAVRGRLTLPATISVGSPTVSFDIEWLPWKSGDNDVALSRTQMGFYPQPILADIEFDSDGQMVLGFRDRQTDMGVGFQVSGGGRITKPSLGLGDIILATIDAGEAGTPPTWSASLSPEHFRDGLPDQDESALGGLASILSLGEIVSGFLAAANVPGAMSIDGGLWYSAAGGDPLRRETLCGRMPYILILPTSTPGVMPYANPGAVPYAELDSEPDAEPDAPMHSEWIPVGSNGDMELLCGPTSTSTNTPTLTETPTSTNTPSPTSTPTATPLPEPIYLPVALGERCDPLLRKADVALVIDTSTSMLRPTRTGREKFSAAQDAAKQFVSALRLDLGADGDAIAIVGFNDAAWTELALDHSSEAAEAAIESLAERVASGTRLDLALHEGARALRDPSRGADRIPVMILLTDGLPNRVPTPMPAGTQEETVFDAAAAAKAEGVEIFAIGVGRPEAEDPIDRVNADLLRAVATSPDMAFVTPDAEELAAIYARIAVRLPCPPERFWPR